MNKVKSLLLLVVISVSGSLMAVRGGQTPSVSVEEGLVKAPATPVVEVSSSSVDSPDQIVDLGNGRKISVKKLISLNIESINLLNAESKKVASLDKEIAKIQEELVSTKSERDAMSNPGVFKSTKLFFTAIPRAFKKLPFALKIVGGFAGFAVLALVGISAGRATAKDKMAIPNALSEGLTAVKNAALYVPRDLMAAKNAAVAAKNANKNLQEIASAFLEKQLN